MIRNSLLLILTGILSLFFTGCAEKSQPLACFKGSPSCITQQHINTHQETQCLSCRAIL